MIVILWKFAFNSKFANSSTQYIHIQVKKLKYGENKQKQ